jgi:hypothetical protein
MNTQLMYLIAEQRRAELQDAGERARLAGQARRKLRDLHQTIRAGTQPEQGVFRGMTAVQPNRAIGGARCRTTW